MAGLSRRCPKPAQIEMLKRQFGLDKPLPVQYVVWLIGNDWMKVDAESSSPR
jgi:ABC-type dipeptide/oligopeptide/nickel transport system permease component